MDAVKHDGGKPRYDYLSWPVLFELRRAEIAVTTAGLTPASVELHIDRALMHLAAYQMGYNRASIGGAPTDLHPCSVAMYFVLSALAPQVTPGTPDWLTHDTGYRLLSPLWPVIEEVAFVMTFGADKYGAHNYRFGMDHGRCFSACMRHLVAVLRGNDKDPETQRYHLAHAAASLLMLVDGIIHGHGSDTRWTTRPAQGSGDTVSPPPVPPPPRPSSPVTRPVAPAELTAEELRRSLDRVVAELDGRA